MDEQMIADVRDAIWNTLCPGIRRTPEDDARYKEAATAAHSVIAGKVAELEKALRIIAADDYDPVGDHQSFTEAAAQIARAALAPYPERRSE